MSVPFSNTNLRVPHGFGNILEGLAREVLREQPEDIPTFAALYFTALLKQREESGLDPAEWGARLEDRFYNNHAFKDTANQGNSSSSKATGSSVNEDKADLAESLKKGKRIIQSAESSPLSDITGATKDEETLEPQQSNELENKVDDESGETDPEPTAEISYRGTADVNICAEELQELEIKRQELTDDVDEESKIGDKDICATELEPTSLSSYHGLADVDVCAEELEQSTLQEDYPANEETDSSRDMIDASLTGVSESPKPVLGEEELSESQDALYTQDNLTLPSAESPAHIEQDAAKELNGISKNENTVAVPVEEEEENNDHSEDAQNTLSEMTDALLGEPEGEDGQFGLNVAAESIPVVEDMNTFDETSTDKDDLETENQDSKDTLAETEAMDEYLASLEKVSSNSASVEVEHYVNIASEVQEENYDNGDCVNTSEPIAEGLTSTDNDQVAFETEEDIEEESNGEGTDLGVLQSNPDAPVETSEALDKNASLIGTSSEGMKEGDVRISQLELPEFDDTPESDYQEDNGIDETKMKEDHVFDYISKQEAEGAFCGPTYEDAEITHAASQRLKTKETDLHQEEGSDHQQDISQASEDQVMENPETESNQQEECSHPQEEEDIMDIPLDDPEANKAAAKIQAGFRGHMTRKKLKPGDKPGEEVSSSGEALNGSQGDTAGGSEGVETDDTSVPEQ